MSATPHHRQPIAAARCIILTISDTRTPQSDASGALIKERLESAGHKVAGYEILPDEPAQIADRVRHWCASGACDAMILTGGTGLAPRDTTYEAISTLLEKRLNGFGELFRMLSYHEIGPAAMLSRAVAGTHGSTVIFSLPGSTPAVHLALEKLILPELGHMVGLLTPKMPGNPT